MNSKDIHTSIIGKILLENISYLGGLIIITFPILIILLCIKEDDNMFQLSVFMNIILGLISFVQAWHLCLDSKLFNILSKDISGNELDLLLSDFFGKKIALKKTIQERINGSIKYVKNFILCLIIYICFFIFNGVYFIIL